MKSQNRENIRKDIQEHLDSLRCELEKLMEQSGTFTPDKAHGRLGKIEAIQNKSIHQRSIRSLESKISGLEKHLREVDSRDFGICEYCREPIGEERRKALPETKICIKCAKRAS